MSDSATIAKALAQYQRHLETTRAYNKAVRDAKIAAGEVIRPRGKPALPEDERIRRMKASQAAYRQRIKAAKNQPPPLPPGAEAAEVNGV
jgi:hypothetical protein